MKKASYFMWLLGIYGCLIFVIFSKMGHFLCSSPFCCVTGVNVCYNIRKQE